MSSTCEDPLFDFDLDFLVNQPTNNIADLQARVERLRKSVIYLKPRVRQLSYYVTALKSASRELEGLRIGHAQMKESWRQQLVEINNFTDKVARLENENQAGQAREKEKDETISELQNKIIALQTVHTQLKLLVKEKNKTEPIPLKGDRKKGKVGVLDNAKKGFLEKEVERLRIENNRLSKLQKENEKLRIDNSRIPSLEKKIEDLCNSGNVSKSEKINEVYEISKIQKLEKEIETLRKENNKILKFQKEIENLNKENVKIPKLEKEIESLHKENDKIPKLLKEIGNLQKENAKIPKLLKDIESLRKENSKITKLGNDNETIFKQNIKISNLEKDIETLRIKNAKIEIANKTFNKEIGLPHPTLATKDKGEVLPKKNNLTRKYKSLPIRNNEYSDNSEAENDIFEDDLLSPAPTDTIIPKTSPVADKCIGEFDNDNSNEVVSVDTGRGSSLANSDTDKGSHSPEYFFNDSPSKGDNSENNEKTNDVSMPSGQIPSEDMEETIITIIKNQNIDNPKNSTIRKRHSNLRAVNQTNAARKGHNSVDTSENVSTIKHTQDVQEKECLELNNSLQCESHIDIELEQIFNEMKLNFNAVSPIPTTPIGMHEENSKSSTSEPKKKIDKSDEFMRIVTVLLLHYAQARNNDSNNSIEKLIACLETTLKSKEILPLDSLLNLVTNLGKSDHILSHDDNNLMSTANTETTTTSEILHNNNCKNKQVQNMYNARILRDENQTQLLCNDNNAVSSDPLSLDKDTYNNVLKDKRAEKGIEQCLSMSTDNNRRLLNHTISDELAIDNEIPKALGVGKKGKNKKNSKLEKLKKKLKPKYKIRREKTPDNLRIKPKQTFSIKKKLTVNDTSASLNDKDVYENAVKIMAEINSQQNAKLAKSPSKHTNHQTSPRLNSLEKNIQGSGAGKEYHNCSTTTPGSPKVLELLNPCSVVLTKDPLLLSPRKVENSTTNQVKEDNSTTQRLKDNNISTTHRLNDNHSYTQNNTLKITEENISMTQRAEENDSTTHEAKENNLSTHKSKEDNSMTPKGEGEEVGNIATHSAKESNESSDELPSRKRRRRSSNEPLIQYKRVLRSDTIHKRLSTEDNTELSNSKAESNSEPINSPDANNTNTQVQSHENTLQGLQLDQNVNVVSYGDLDIFSEDLQLEKKSAIPVKKVNTDSTTCNPKESILCCMIEKHGVETTKPFEKKIPDKIIKQVCEKIEQEIIKIGLMNDTKNAMNSFVADLRKLNYKYFIAGLMKYLVKPERKIELFGKVSSSPAPAMTKAEQILLYVIAHLKTQWPQVDIVDAVLCSIEYTLFKLNRTPEFDVIESTSHFYAVLCRYFRAKSRLRLFILDAMYCIQFKSVPLIKQCLDVWMHIIPLAHMGIAKSPMVTCLVYLLHFYKCEDRHNRVQDMRNILSRKYFYQITDWNESKILEMFKNSIKELKDISIEKKMLRLALIILAKRHGPQWCQINIIKNLLQPMIEKENTPNNVKEFCVSVIGPLMKPYPADMKVHCEIAINQLVDILNNNPTPQMEEAAITSMIYINRHDQRSINKTLLLRKMKPMSSELEKTIRDYVKSKPLKVWKKNLSSITR